MSRYQTTRIPSTGEQISRPVEDCRDFLRTGRCKYGASCKFNHPANVQSGGGMKAPLDPSEPMYPVRPNEPVCQYYMKHGTCKFGQSCKFNHPPPSSLTTATIVTGGNTVVLNADGTSVPQHVLLNPVDASSAMMVQFLPQRPEAPDCMFFLKNGRCKYGATCRYHHPVGYNQPRQMKQPEPVRVAPVPIHLPQNEAVMLHNQMDNSMGHRLQYISSGMSGYGRSVQNGNQYVISNEPPVHRSTSGQYLQEIGVEYETPVGEPINPPLGMEHTSSSSSIASSYETAMSNYEGSGQAGWTRPMRSSSNGNLHSYGGVRSGFRPTVSEQSLSSRNSRHRTASFGSVGDTNEASQQYHEAQRFAPHSLPTHLESGSYMENRRYMGAGQPPPPSEIDTRQRSVMYRENNGYSNGQNNEDQRGHMGLPPHRNLPPGRRRTGQSGEEVDQGLSMMTSALLTMLDTPEEPAKANPVSRETSSSTLHMSSPPVTPKSGNTLPTNEPLALDEQLMPPSASYPREMRQQHPQNHLYQTQQRYQQYDDQYSVSKNFRQQTSPYRTRQAYNHEDAVDMRWNPAWQNHHQTSLQSRHQPHSPSNEDAGLYFP